MAKKNMLQLISVVSALCMQCCQCKWCDMTKGSCHTLFWLCQPNEQNGAIVDVIGNWGQCQPHHMSKMSLCTLFQSCYLTCSGAIDDTVGIMWCWCQCQQHHMIKRYCCTSFWSSWPKNAMVLLTMLFTSCNASAYAKCITWPKSHVAPSFSHLDLTNAIVILTILLASHDADTSANSVKWLRSHVTSRFDHLDIMNEVPSVLCHACPCTNSIKWSKKVMLQLVFPSST